MKSKQTISLTVCLLFVFILAGCGQEKKEEYKTYKNSRYNFSIDYPASWTLGKAPTNNDGRVFTDPEKEVECRAYGFSNSLLNKEGKPQSLKEFVDWITTDKRVGEGLYTHVITRTDTTLDGNKAMYVLKEKEMNLWEAIYVLGPTEGRALHCIYGNKKEMEQYKNIFKDMRASFKIGKSLES
jgi:hypothetical protein